MYKKTKSFICAFMAFLIVFTLHSYILTVGGESGYPSAELDNSTNFDFNYLENEILASRTVFDRTAKAVKSFEGQIKEVEQLRTANTKHFQMADGTFEAFAFLDDIHRRDASGKWQDIDNSLTPLDGKYTTEDGYVSFAEVYSAYLSSNNNLVDASVAAGSEHAIGFTDDVWPTEVNHWVELFLEARYSMGLSVAYACAYASNQETRLRLLVYYQ